MLKSHIHRNGRIVCPFNVHVFFPSYHILFIKIKFQTSWFRIWTLGIIEVVKIWFWDLIYPRKVILKIYLSILVFSFNLLEMEIKFPTDLRNFGEVHLMASVVNHKFVSATIHCIWSSLLKSSLFAQHRLGLCALSQDCNEGCAWSPLLSNGLREALKKKTGQHWVGSMGRVL